MTIDEGAKALSDAIWQEHGPAILEKMRCSLMDRFMRKLIGDLNESADVLISQAIRRCMENIMNDPVLTGMFETCSKRAASKRVMIKLSHLGVRASTLTEAEREWLKRHNVDLEE